MAKNILDTTDKAKCEINFFTNVLLADTIHKLKNGLGGITGFATLLERDFNKDDPQIRMVTKIQEGVRKVNDISSCLMLLVREHELNFEKFRLTTLIKQMWANFQSEDENKTVDLVIHPNLNTKDALIFADSNLIERMIGSVYKFIQYISGDLKRIILDDKKGIKVIIEFYYFPAPDDDNESFETYLETLHAVEPRLSLAIIDMIVSFHKGKLRFSGTDGINIISIELPKGISK